METSAKANINVENVRCRFIPTVYAKQATFHLYDLYLSLFAGVSDTCQRHQIENGYKIGIKTPMVSLRIKCCENNVNFSL